MSLLFFSFEKLPVPSYPDSMFLYLIVKQVRGREMITLEQGFSEMVAVRLPSSESALAASPLAPPHSESASSASLI